MNQFIEHWNKNLEFLDVHYHASPDSYQRRYNVNEAGKIFASLSGGCVLKNHLGSSTALASLAQEMQLPVFGSVVLNDIAGGLSVKSVQQALCQYYFPHSGRLLIHLPTVVRSAHNSVMNRKVANNAVQKFANKPQKITNGHQELLPETKELVAFAQNNNVVISTGHASKQEVYALIEYIDKTGGGCRLMLNQPANPITGMTAEELFALGSHEWLFIEQTALTVLLGYQSFEDFSFVISKLPNLVYSSDLGQQCQIDIPEWLKKTQSWFRQIGVSDARKKEICLDNPLKMLAP